MTEHFVSEQSAEQPAESEVSVAVRPPEKWTQSWVDLAKDLFCKDLTNEETAFFLAVAHRTGLDPFRGQILARKQWDSSVQREKMLIITTIVGARSLAADTKMMNGMDGPYFCGKDAQWTDVWLEEGPPLAAKMTVYRKDWEYPVTVVTLYSEFVQTRKDGSPNRFWRIMPSVMLGKVAEMACYRKAFPEPLAELYISEELIERPSEEREKITGGNADSLETDSDLASRVITELFSAAARRAEKTPKDGEGQIDERQVQFLVDRIRKLAGLERATEEDVSDMSLFIFGKDLDKLSLAEIGVWLERWWTRVTRKNSSGKNVSYYVLRQGVEREIRVVYRMSAEAMLELQEEADENSEVVEGEFTDDSEELPDDESEEGDTEQASMDV